MFTSVVIEQDTNSLAICGCGAALVLGLVSAVQPQRLWDETPPLDDNIFLGACRIGVLCCRTGRESCSQHAPEKRALSLPCLWSSEITELP